MDIGGTGIKAALVDIEEGQLLEPVRRTSTPRPATPASVVERVADLVGENPAGVLGVGYPGVVRGGVAATAANLDPGWVGLDLVSLLEERFDRRGISVINDADAAGLAEMRFGAGVGASGVVVMVTLGTGIGTAVFNRGVLLPNTEFGHLEIDGREAEELASGRVRASLSWKDWSEHLEMVLRAFERLMRPDLFIIGGGISAEFRRFCESLDTATPVVAAVMGNGAGIVGAALAAAPD